MPLWNESRSTLARDVGLLLFRVSVSGLMVYAHGWPKLAEFSAKAARFPDPLGVGSSTSLTLAIFGELVCPIAIALGALTRVAAVPAAFTMWVAALVVHAGDALRERELAIVYAIAFTLVAATGPGRFSLDQRLFGRR